MRASHIALGLGVLCASNGLVFGLPELVRVLAWGGELYLGPLETVRNGSWAALCALPAFGAGRWAADRLPAGVGRSALVAALVLGGLLLARNLSVTASLVEYNLHREHHFCATGLMQTWLETWVFFAPLGALPAFLGGIAAGPVRR